VCSRGRHPEQRVFLANDNLDVDPPLNWKVYGDPYSIDQ
jgi:chitosanase